VYIFRGVLTYFLYFCIYISVNVCDHFVIILLTFCDLLLTFYDILLTGSFQRVIFSIEVFLKFYTLFDGVRGILMVFYYNLLHFITFFKVKLW